MDFFGAISRCDDNGVKIQIKRIEQYKEYTMLCEMTSVDYKEFRNMFNSIPFQIRAWYKFANGGYLFDTQFLSTKLFDIKNNIQLQKFSTYNSSFIRKLTGVSERYVAFAIASFGDLYCFSQEGDSEIIQWSVAEHKVVGKWSNFHLWLKQEVDISIELVAEECLLPMGVYYDGDLL